jgi:hypothetical protein
MPYRQTDWILLVPPAFPCNTAMAAGTSILCFCPVGTAVTRAPVVVQELAGAETVCACVFATQGRSRCGRPALGPLLYLLARLLTKSPALPTTLSTPLCLKLKFPLPHPYFAQLCCAFCP